MRMKTIWVYFVYNDKFERLYVNKKYVVKLKKMGFEVHQERHLVPA